MFWKQSVNSLTSWQLKWNFRYLILDLISVIGCWGNSCKTALWWMPLDLTDDKSTMAQVMAWCHQTTSHYLSHCWPRSTLPYDVARLQWVKKFMCYTISNLQNLSLISSRFQWISGIPYVICQTLLGTSPCYLKKKKTALFFMWVRSRTWVCLVTWFCHHLIAKPGNKDKCTFVTWPMSCRECFPYYWPMWGDSIVTGGVPSQKSGNKELDAFFVVILNKPLYLKGCRWFETKWFHMRHQLYDFGNVLSQWETALLCNSISLAGPPAYVSSFGQVRHRVKTIASMDGGGWQNDNCCLLGDTDQKLLSPWYQRCLLGDRDQ